MTGPTDTSPRRKGQGRPAGRLRSSTATLAFLLLAGCAAHPPAPLSAAPGEQHLFAAAYGDIGQYYIEEVSAERLAMAGLRRLVAIDPAVTVSRRGGEVVLMGGGTERRLPAPPPQDAKGWATLTALALDAARQASPAVADAGAARVDETVLRGSLGLLDRFSAYATPPVAREHRAVRDGFGGIGVTLAPDESEARIAAVLPDTPALAAGLAAGDRILAIDGAATQGVPAAEVNRRLRGPPGSAVTVTVARNGIPAPRSLALQRAHIVEPTATLALDGGIARLRITSFNQHTAQSLAALLRQAHDRLGHGLKAVVLDLRDNPGGLLEQSVEVASLFLDGGTVVSTIGRHPRSFQHFAAPPRHDRERLPLAVLVNGGSASAAEVVAAALQDSGRAVVVGTASFGKGTVQTVLRLPDDGELTVTWAKLITPRGYVLHHHGIVPTICTAALDDDGVAPTLRGAALAEAALTVDRERLDDRGWQALRDRCPASREAHAADVQIAERLLADPPLYRRALAALPGSRGRGVETARAMPRSGAARSDLDQAMPALQ